MNLHLKLWKDLCKIRSNTNNMKYQRTNPNYKKYRRKYEKGFRDEKRILVRYNSWKSMNKVPYGKAHIEYLLSRFLKELK